MKAVELLKKHNIKLTPLRLQILKILEEAQSPLSYDEILSKIDANKTTFYRCMDIFEANDIVIKSENNHKNFYELSNGAKAYFVCDVCHKMTNIKMPKISQNNVKSVVVKGICDECF
ncbi:MULTISPECIES: transcriptional repressor [unclassified Campylobacter]|uniref:Fur family transcriptional regulator n=1 Tax=unclassified Campylobacter TaxID=2593542 RepID=UPI001472A109|nr:MULTISPECIES: transcriptional repressor [unclassified Campylobacter]